MVQLSQVLQPTWRDFVEHQNVDQEALELVVDKVADSFDHQRRVFFIPQIM